jgi:hypothetical protein
VRDDHRRTTKDCQLLGKVARLDRDRLEQFVHRVVAFAEQFEDPDPSGVAEGLEELCLRLIQRYRHDLAPPVLESW